MEFGIRLPNFGTERTPHRDRLSDVPDGQIKARLVEACAVLGLDADEVSRLEEPAEILGMIPIALRGLSALALEQAKRIEKLERYVYPQEMSD